MVFTFDVQSLMVGWWFDLRQEKYKATNEHEKQIRSSPSFSAF